jgi:hypothetical protein
MPQPQARSGSHRRSRRTPWRAATVLAPVLVVGVPVGALAARDPVPTLDRLTTALRATTGPQPLAAPAPAVRPAPPAAPAAGQERVECEAGSPCVVTPPAGEDTAFTVLARGGTTDAVLTAETNSGTAPDCANYRERSDDWVRVVFTDAEAGSTWDKLVSLTDRQPLARSAAVRAARKAEVCFSAPYRFRTKRGFPLTTVADGSGDLQGVLATCRPGRRDDPPSPCLLKRSLVKVAGGWVVRLVAYTPARAEDPGYRG